MTVYTINGISLDVPDVMLTPMIQKMLEKGWYEVEEAKAVKIHLRKSDSVLELGSGVGYLAILCARIVGAKNVTTIEANPALLPLIRRNASNNHMEEITLLHGLAVAQSASGKEPFYIPEDFWAGTQKHLDITSSQKIEVPTLNVDDMLAKIEPTILISDVEGAEGDFFYTQLPESLRLVILELHPKHCSQENIRDIFIRLFSQGFCYQTQGSSGAVVVFER
jgi:FkbM family methyltransferase